MTAWTSGMCPRLYAGAPGQLRLATSRPRCDIPRNRVGHAVGLATSKSARQPDPSRSLLTAVNSADQEAPMADAPILTNPLKDMMKAGKVALGMNVRLARSGDIARIAKSTGHDFIFIDGQHAIFTLETIAHIAHTALGCGITPLARVKSVDDQDVQVLLDNGVMGIVYPDVSTAAEARRAVARAKFPPIGRRSAAGAYPVFDYRAMPAGQTVSALNDSTLVVCMIETPEGVHNVEEIAKVDGVDVI